MLAVYNAMTIKTSIASYCNFENNTLVNLASIIGKILGNVPKDNTRQVDEHNGLTSIGWSI